MENTSGNKFLEVKQKFSAELSEFAKQQKEIHRLWNIDEVSAEYLFDFIIDHDLRQLIEVGTSNGYSTFWLAQACQYNGGEMESIEVDQERFELSKKNLKRITNLTQHFGLAENIILNLSKTYDFAFIDAGKIGYINYIKSLLPKLSDEAIIIADNVVSHQKTVHEYLDFIDSDSQFESELINIGTGLMISKFKRNKE